MVVPITSAPRAPARSIRLSVDLLDRMMNGVSEMVLARNELARRLRDSGDTTLETAVDRLSMTVAELRDTVTRTRICSSFMGPVEPPMRAQKLRRRPAALESGSSLLGGVVTAMLSLLPGFSRR